MARKTLHGSVVSNACNQTVTVAVQRRYMHPIYKKFVTKTNKFAAHDALNACVVGEYVQIEECRPISKTKKWQVISKKIGL